MFIFTAAWNMVFVFLFLHLPMTAVAQGSASPIVRQNSISFFIPNDIYAIILRTKQMEANMALQLGDIAPDFEADTTEGRIHFHDYIEGSWALIVSHPKDFTPVCTTELGSMAKLKPEFDKRGVKMIGISVDSVDDHLRWKQDIKDVTGSDVTYPMIGDSDLAVAKLYGMIHPNASGNAKGRTAADNQTVRNVLIIGPDKKIKLILTYPMTTGRNFNEILRVIDSLQLTATKSVATPANWKQGEDVIILASVSDEAAKEKFPQGWKALKPYLRLVKLG
jgi:alkyl hydroperoxide reductase subunit AhpC